MCRSRSDVGLFVGSCIDLISELVLFIRIELGGANHFKKLSMILSGGKDPIFIYLDLFFTNCFRISLLDLY